MTRCSICAIGEAKYVCQRCGSLVCQNCFHREAWLCEACSPRYAKRSGDGGFRVWIPLALPFSLLLIFIGIVLMILATIGQTESSFVIILFPIPFVFGGGPIDAHTILPLAILFLSLPILLYLLIRRAIR